MKKIDFETLLEYKFISGLKLSDNKENLAFVVKNADLDKNKYKSHIYNYNTKTKALIKLTGMGEEGSFDFLDDETIIFKANREEKEKEDAKNGLKYTNFYTIKVNGGEAEKFKTVPFSVLSMDKFDEDTVLFVAEYDPAAPDLIAIEMMEEKEKKEALAKAVADLKTAKNYEVLDEIPFWSNGGGYTNKKRNRLYKYVISTGEITPLTGETILIENIEVDKGRVLLAYQDFQDMLKLYNKVAELDMATGELKHLFEDEHFDTFRIKILGDKILLFGPDDREIGNNTNPKFYILEDGKLKNITPEGNDFSAGSAAASDSRHGGNPTMEVVDDKLYFTSTRGFETYLFTLDLEGNMDKVIGTSGTVDGFQVDGDKIYFVGFREDKLQEIYLYEDGKEEQLTEFNEAIAKEYSVITPEHIVLDHEGVELDGFIIKPVDFDENKKYPTVLEVHGGPKAAFGKIFYSELQLLANKGYVVIYTNPRGSDGKGNAFSDIRGKYGTIDYEDIMFFTKEMVKRYPFIDENRVGITGGSYGGFMTNWVVGHTDFFKAAVTQRSISNWISKFNTTDIGYFFVKDQCGATPWDGMEKLWEQSPIKYAENVKTPTLIIHSEEDYRCDVDQGYQFFTALKYHGVKTKMVMFRGENHELSRSGRPQQRIRRLKEIVGWFDEHL